MNGTTIHKFDPPVELKKDEYFEYTATYPISPGEKVISKEESGKKFKCRVCGHDKYEKSYSSNLSVCLGCSVLFKDHKKFSQ